MVANALRRLIEAGESLHAPTLLPYEVASGLTRLIAAGMFNPDRLPDTWRAVLAIPIDYHRLSARGHRIVEIALELRRKSAYDAAYLALSEELRCAVWTLDGSLARNATGHGFSVHLIE
jgi:predicted nucleic acid-binding protein